MAKFNGVELKNYKKIGEGWEGYMYSGSVFLNGERLGTVTDDASGGEYRYSFNTDVLNDTLTAFNHFFPCPFTSNWSLDTLIFFLNELNSYEKMFKRAMKAQKYKTLVVMRSLEGDAYYYTTDDNKDRIMNSVLFTKTYKEQSARGGYAIAMLFNCEEDFNLTATA